MDRRLFFACLAVSALAAGPPPAREDDRVDLLLLGSDRPHRIRLRVTTGGKPYREACRAWVDRVFDHYDRDGDGRLQPAEAARMPSPHVLAALLRGAVPFGPKQKPWLAYPLSGETGVVSRELFRALMLRNSKLRPVRVVEDGMEAVWAERVTDVLFRRLDADGDGRLGEKELKAAPARLAALDADEDGVFTREELGSRRDYDEATGYAYRPGPKRMVDCTEDDARADAAEEVMTRYDRDKDGSLSPAEAGLGRHQFDSADADGDGKLSSEEVFAWLNAGAGETLTVRLGRPVGPLAALEALGVGPGKTSRAVGDARLSLGGRHTDERKGPARLRRMLFDEFDARSGGKDAVTDAERLPESSALHSLFAAADGDGDGRLTRRELGDFVDLVAAGFGVGVTVSAGHHGRDLFAALDPDDDGKLTVRRLRSAWATLAPLCRDRAKGLARAEVPFVISVTVADGIHDRHISSQDFAVTPTWPVQSRLLAPRPPAWFSRMDANGDGDLSEREWLGAVEDFKAADADGDGLISPAEARAFDAARRKSRR